MSERLAVDSLMTADGEVVQLPTVSADVTTDAYIEDIKYCPFCGEEL